MIYKRERLLYYILECIKTLKEMDFIIKVKADLEDIYKLDSTIC